MTDDGMLPVEQYEELWESINGKGSWFDNPFVWVYGYKMLERDK